MDISNAIIISVIDLTEVSIDQRQLSKDKDFFDWKKLLLLLHKINK